MPRPPRRSRHRRVTELCEQLLHGERRRSSTADPPESCCPRCPCSCCRTPATSASGTAAACTSRPTAACPPSLAASLLRRRVGRGRHLRSEPCRPAGRHLRVVLAQAPPCAGRLVDRAGCDESARRADPGEQRDLEATGLEASAACPCRRRCRRWRTSVILMPAAFTCWAISGDRSGHAAGCSAWSSILKDSGLPLTAVDAVRAHLAADALEQRLGLGDVLLGVGTAVVLVAGLVGRRAGGCRGPGLVAELADGGLHERRPVESRTRSPDGPPCAPAAGPWC